MAVEATHFNHFPPQLLQERAMVNPSYQGNGFCVSNQPQMRFPGTPFPITLPENHSCYYQQVVSYSLPAKTSINTESGLTCNIPASRKRCRDSTGELYAVPNVPAAQKNNSVSQIPSFVGENVLPQIQQHQLEIDAIIFQHTKKIKLELQEKQKRHTKLLVASIGDVAMKKLKEKDEHIQQMVKLNFVLQEKVKSLYIENQLWRDLAQTNEATAISLRTNLEQALAQAGGVAVDEEEVESCCGSSDDGRDNEGGKTTHNDGDGKRWHSDRRCRQCGEREACVLLLPCRHLCLCNICGSGSHQLQACPVCNSTMNATLHVNMSS